MSLLSARPSMLRRGSLLVYSSLGASNSLLYTVLRDNNNTDPLASQQFAQAVFNNPGGPPPIESEDCLYLNVYAPSGSPGGNGRAVMFWIYGGSLQFGTAGMP
jgi:carboxylesterase type B